MNSAHHRELDASDAALHLFPLEGFSVSWFEGLGVEGVASVENVKSFKANSVCEPEPHR